MPKLVLHFFEVAGKLLPALGFAMLLKQSLSKRWMLVLFLLGWVVIGATSMSVTALAIFATAVATWYLLWHRENRSRAAPAVNAARRGGRLL